MARRGRPKKQITTERAEPEMTTQHAPAETVTTGSYNITTCRECGGKMTASSTVKINTSYPGFMDPIRRMRYYKCGKCGRTAKYSFTTPTIL